MARIVIVGAGIGGIAMAFEMKALLRPQDSLTVVSDSDVFQFVPSNPWVAVNWRRREDVVVPLAPVMARRGIDFLAVGAKRLDPGASRIELADGRILGYDFLVIATGPDLAFDEIEGFGPGTGLAESVCKVDHAAVAGERWAGFCADPGPLLVGAAQGASCFGPAYETAMIMHTDLRRRQIRHRVPITFVTPEPYIGHLGLGGVGDTRGLLERAFRERTIKWITNARIDWLAPGSDGLRNAAVSEVDDDGAVRRVHDLPYKHAVFLPAFRGVACLRGDDGGYLPGLCNPRGFVLVDAHQRNPAYPNVFAVGVCIAIPPYEKTPLPVGMPKTGYMIETMVTATAHNIRALIDGREATATGTWNALCLADFGDRGVAFLAKPQIPPRNVNWSSEGRWVHVAKLAYEKYFLRKVRRGISEPGYERYLLRAMGLARIARRHPPPARAA